MQLRYFIRCPNSIMHLVTWCNVRSAGLQAHEEVDRVVGQKSQPEVSDYTQLKYLMRCVNESMRLYPHPPVLLRRAQIQDELPGAHTGRTPLQG